MSDQIGRPDMCSLDVVGLLRVPIPRVYQALYVYIYIYPVITGQLTQSPEYPTGIASHLESYKPPPNKGPIFQIPIND